MFTFDDLSQVEKENNLGFKGQWRPEDGSNKVRVLSGFMPNPQHFDKAKKKGFTCFGKGKGCPYCENGEKPNVKFLTWLLVKSDEQSVEMAELPYSVIKAIGELKKDSDWSFDGLPPYDLNIKKEGTGMNTRYTVTPVPNRDEVPEDLQEEFEQLKEQNSIEEFVQGRKDKAMGELLNNTIDNIQL